MSDREKLIELIQESIGCMYYGDVCVNEEIDIGDQEIARIANHLIASGVVVQVHGEWIHDINNLYSCSVCMERETMSHKRLKPYCPNCGAKMKGAKDE